MKRRYWLFGPVIKPNQKRQLIIEDCRDCADGYPGRLDGTGAACGAMEGYKKVPDVGDTTPIPVWCPRLKQRGLVITNKDPNPAALYNACLSYRHDFGLLSQEEQTELRIAAINWKRAWQS